VQAKANATVDYAALEEQLFWQVTGLGLGLGLGLARGQLFWRVYALHPVTQPPVLTPTQIPTPTPTRQPPPLNPAPWQVYELRVPGALAEVEAWRRVRPRYAAQEQLRLEP
jgi:hypothetical protein